MKLLGMCAAITATLMATSASAANFSFSFSSVAPPGPYDSIPGTVTGRIFGLTDNATSAATAIYLDTYPGSGPSASSAYDTFYFNTFTLLNGLITGADVRAQGPQGILFINTYIPVYGSNVNLATFSGNTQSVSNFDGLSGITFTPLAAPEPAAWALMIVGFGAVGLALRHRQRMTVSYT